MASNRRTGGPALATTTILTKHEARIAATMQVAGAEAQWSATPIQPQTWDGFKVFKLVQRETSTEDRTIEQLRAETTRSNIDVYWPN